MLPKEPSNGAVASARSEELDQGDGRDDDATTDDVLVEDISIDGMCGVY
jgi:mycofactocin precursor